MERHEDEPGFLKKVRSKMTKKELSECMTALETFQCLCTSNPDAVGQNIAKVFESFPEYLLTDNEKVQEKALSVLFTIIRPLKNHMAPVISQLIKNVTHVFSAENGVLDKIAEKVLLEMVEHLEAELLIKPLSVLSQKAKKGKHFLVDIMTSLVIYLFSDKPSLLIKYTLPLLWQLLDMQTYPPELKQSTANLINNMYAFMGKNLISQTNKSPSNSKARAAALKTFLENMSR